MEPLDGEEFYAYEEKSETDLKVYITSECVKKINELKEIYPDIPDVCIINIYMSGVETGASITAERLALDNKETFDFKV